MKTFNKYNDIVDMEELFLELAHLDELEIKFDFINYYNTLDYIYKDDVLFIQFKRIKMFVINYKEIWSVFVIRFNLTREDIKEFMEGMIDKHLNLKGYRTTY